MNLYAASCEPLHLGCYGSGNLINEIDNVASAYDCQVACANTPTCILTQYGEFFCNLFSTDFADTYAPNSEIDYPDYCTLFAFYTFDTCPVATPPPS